MNRTQNALKKQHDALITDYKKSLDNGTPRTAQTLAPRVTYLGTTFIIGVPMLKRVTNELGRSTYR